MPALGAAPAPNAADVIIEDGPAADPRYPHFLSLVLPAHNEEGNIEAVTWDALAILPEHFQTFEIVIVDDGSTDATPRLIDRLAADDARVRVIHHPQNRGYGAALRSGFATARGDRILFMDADRQFDIREVAKLAPLTARYDIIAGYRLRRNDPWRRVALGAAFNTVVKVLFGVWVRDIDCGFKLFRADLLRGLELQAPGALLNTEILALAHRQGATLAEVGVTHHPRSAGAQSGGSPRVVLRSLGEMLHLWRRLRADNLTPERPEPRALGV
jgi:glycosyltransferase involved in cell wall biosynthesis